MSVYFCLAGAALIVAIFLLETVTYFYGPIPQPVPFIVGTVIAFIFLSLKKG